MRPFCLALPLVLGSSVPGHAQFLAGAAPGESCRSAVAAAERGNGIPAHLLAAINRVESGRRDPATGAVHPWPWTANAEGQGLFYETKAEAVVAVRAMQARGIRSIDVGCGQINLMYHPDAFPSLETAFDPQANAVYAAKFLKELFARSGDWNKAAALYHSATAVLGEEYQRKVLAVWPEEQKLAGPTVTTPLAQAWGATMTTAPPGFTPVMRLQTPGLAQGPRRITLPVVAGGARTAPIGLAYQPPASRRIGG